MRVVGFRRGVIGWDLAGNAEALPLSARGTLSARKMRAKAGQNTLATTFSSRTIVARNVNNEEETEHDQPYRAVSGLGLQHIKAFREQDARRYGGQALRF